MGTDSLLHLVIRKQGTSIKAGVLRAERSLCLRNRRLVGRVLLWGVGSGATSATSEQKQGGYHGGQQAMV